MDLPFVLSLRKLGANLGLSSSTVQRYMKGLGKKWRKVGVHPKLTDLHKSNRVKMALQFKLLERIDPDWIDNLYVSDESYIGTYKNYKKL